MSQTSLKHLVQSRIYDISPYQPGMSIEALAHTHGIDPTKITKLASNENPLGMSPKAKQAINSEPNLKEVSRYPVGFQLIEALSKYHAVEPDTIILGNGSNDVLDLIARAFLGNNTEAISSEYAFSVYPLITTIAGAKNIVVPASNFGHDLTAMKAAITPKTRVIWIANPNNPTGTFIAYSELKVFLEEIPSNVIVVLDEAYFEYLPKDQQIDSTKWLKQFPNLILTRTFSKIYGLAGLRVGYGLANLAIAELLNRVRQPFNVNSLGLAAAVVALDDQKFVEDSLQTNRQGMKQLTTALDKRSIEYIPSFGNFLTIKVPNAAKVNQDLLSQGVIVRPLALQGMADYLRVSIGLPAENQKFIEVLSNLI